VLVAVVGQVACGKSTLARALAARLDAVRIEGDRLRDELLGDARRPVHEAHWERAFAPGFEQRLYAELLRRAESALADGRSVVLDACFPRQARRLDARARARRLGAAFLLVECRTRQETVRERLAQRDAEAGHAGWQEIHDDLTARWEPVTGLAPDEHLCVDGDGDIEVAVHHVLTAPCLREARPAGPEVVTFDCWNTLLYEEDWQTAHALRVTELRAAAAEAGREVSVEDAERAFNAGWDRHMRLWREGVATGAHEVAVWSLAELGLREPHPALEHLVTLFQEASHSSRVLALDGACALLEALTAAGIRCALVCDTGLTPGRVVRLHLDRHGLLKSLAVQVFSDEVGVPKPDPRAFRAALEPLGAAPERAWHVGDLRRTDVAGARALGMTTVRIRDRFDDDSELPEADRVVSSHAALAALLGVVFPK
jgi:putative hydrolase of the HAD superfamily